MPGLPEDHADAVGEIRGRLAETIRSHFGRFEIHGLSVEVMGALQKRTQDGSWGAPTSIADHREFAPFRGGTVPVLSLSYEARAYERLGRTERAERLRAHVDR